MVVTEACWKCGLPVGVALGPCPAGVGTMGQSRESGVRMLPPASPASAAQGMDSEKPCFPSQSWVQNKAGKRPHPYPALRLSVGSHWSPGETGSGSPAALRKNPETGCRPGSLFGVRLAWPRVSGLLVHLCLTRMTCSLPWVLSWKVAFLPKNTRPWVPAGRCPKHPGALIGPLEGLSNMGSELHWPGFPGPGR